MRNRIQPMFLHFHVLLDPDPEQKFRIRILGKSSGSMLIRIHNTGTSCTCHSTVNPYYADIFAPCILLLLLLLLPPQLVSKDVRYMAILKMFNCRTMQYRERGRASTVY